MENTILGASLSLMVAAAVATELSARTGLPAPDFTLTDQYDHAFKLSSARGQTVLLVSEDRNQFMGTWTKAVREKYNAGSSTRVRIVPVANLESVPGIFDRVLKNGDAVPSGKREEPETAKNGG
jgi:hypothetical protein